MSSLPKDHDLTSSELLDDLYSSFQFPIKDRQNLVFEASKHQSLSTPEPKQKLKTEDVMYVGSAKAKKRSTVSRFTTI